jgi:thiamine-phosphate pyrophosphorylase
MYPPKNGLDRRGDETAVILSGMNASERRAFIRRALFVYAVSDSRWLSGRDLCDVVREAIAGGATFVQLREKNATHEQRVAIGRRLSRVCHDAGVAFVIDDDVACAAEVGADGVHVGQSDETCSRAREILGPDAIVGVSASTVEQALAAQKAGADYLGVSAVFPTATKTDVDCLGVEGLRRICAAVDIPCVAIGGITHGNVRSLSGTGVDGVAVVSEIFAVQDPRAATKRLFQACVNARIGVSDANDPGKQPERSHVSDSIGPNRGERCHER